MRTRWMTCGLLLLLAGCAAAPVPADRYFRLDPPLPAPTSVRAAPDVLVEPFSAHGVYAERALLFAEAGAVAQYSNLFWAEPVTRMLDDALRASLRAALGDEHVHGRQTRARPDFVVQPRLRRLEQGFDAAGKVSAVFGLEFVVNDNSGAPRFVLGFEESAPVASPAPEDYVAALAPLVASANHRLVERLAQEFTR